MFLFTLFPENSTMQLYAHVVKKEVKKTPFTEDWLKGECFFRLENRERGCESVR
jgi:hypothetical protein